ncbi:GNAT family N-acetyltransferase [Porticoccus sp. GXU_MW_L64]
MEVITEPEPLNDKHLPGQFDCGVDSLNDWLIKRALKNQISGASRTFVACLKNHVVGYYALASGSVERLEAPKNIARNMPTAIPVMVLGRLAVDKTMQGKHLGAALLRDALLRTLRVSKEVGLRAVLVHAISDNAKFFYEQYGFKVSPIDSMTLMLPIKSIQGP